MGENDINGDRVGTYISTLLMFTYCSLRAAISPILDKTGSGICPRQAEHIDYCIPPGYLIAASYNELISADNFTLSSKMVRSECRYNGFLG